MTAYVLYDNVFNATGATVTYSDEVDNSGPFAHDNLLYDRWVHGVSTGGPYIRTVLAGSETINAWSIFGHNLGTNGATVSLLRYNSGAWSTVDAYTPSDDKPIFRIVDPAISDTGFQISITSPSTDDQIYHAAIGQALKLKPLNTGFKPPMFEQYIAKNSVTEQNLLLGRSVSKVSRTLNIKQNAITTAELYADYKGFLDHAVKWPFMFCWNYESYPGDSVFCWLDDMAPEPVYSSLCHLSIDMKVRALLWNGVSTT